MIEISVFSKAPQHLLFALSAPDQIPLLQHAVQDACNGVVPGLDVFFWFPGCEFLDMNRSAGAASGSVSVWHSCKFRG